MTVKKYNFWVVFFFSLSIVLRFVLALINTEANDYHFEVIDRIMKGLSVNNTDCWQCYHPKLFHFVAAEVIRILNLTDWRIQMITAQLCNFAAGIATLYIIWISIKELCRNQRIRLIVLALFALNPRFIAISSQASNDIFVILFSTLSIYLAWQFLKRRSSLWGILSLLAATLAALSKASGLVLFVCLGLIFFVKLFSPTWENLRKKILFLLLMIPMLLISVFYIGPYHKTYQESGDALTANVGKGQKLRFFKKTYSGAPGSTSVVDTYMTFRIVDLVRTPYIPEKGYPINRTSLWSQLYGRAVFLQFDQYPFSWRNTAPSVINLGRALMILGLFPVAFFLVGLTFEITKYLRRFLKTGFSYFATNPNWIFPLFSVAFLAMEVDLTANYRDFVAMKDIYIFPALLGFSYCLIIGLKKYWVRLSKYRLLLVSFLALLLILWIIDTSILIANLLPGFLEYII